MSLAHVQLSPQVATPTSHQLIMNTRSSSCPWGKPANVAPSSPWAKTGVSTPAPCSLEDVMSEQLALEVDQSQLGSREVVAEQEKLLEEFAKAGSEAAAGPDTVQSDAELAAQLAAAELGVDPNDELIARYLQREFDKEYDAMVDRVEKNYNGTSKVSVSFENYKMKHQRQEAGAEVEGDEDDDDFDEEFPEFPTSTKWETPSPLIGSRGYSGQGKNIVTKHDKTICGRKNAERLMEFPPEFDSGDGEGMDMQLPNHVYNGLKAHSNQSSRRSQKVHEKKEHSTAIKAVDQKTRIALFKLINSGFLAGIDGVISEGKEAVIFKATGGEKDEKPLPPHVILKIFKTTMNEFRTRAKYVQGDHRLSSDVYKKQNPRKIMKLWAEKECMNLKRMCRQNLPCPTPISLKKHVLAMTCVGGEHPAPKLKMARLSTEDMQDAYEQTVQIMKQLYHKCGLIHADLSEYNLLWHEDQVWVIDVSQAVEKENPHSNDFLLRDCHNVTKFFKQAGVHGVSTPEELFMEVTSYSLSGEGKVFAAEAQKFIKTDYAFDYYFDQIDEEQESQSSTADSSDSEEEDSDLGEGGNDEEATQTSRVASGDCLRGEENETVEANKGPDQGGEGGHSQTGPFGNGITIAGGDKSAVAKDGGESHRGGESDGKRWEISCDERLDH